MKEAMDCKLVLGYGWLGAGRFAQSLGREPPA